jgi:transcriptional regulator with XRE-family HTH domain
MVAFSENILLWRLHRSLSQEKLAAMAGIPRPNLSDIEKGKRDVTLSTIRSLANALRVSPGSLVDGKPPRPANWKEDLSRGSMERIASSVAHGRPPEDPAECEVYKLLTEVVSCSIRSAGTGKKHLPMPSSRSSHAWLLLRALYPAETARSLVARSLEHSEREWIKDR